MGPETHGASHCGKLEEGFFGSALSAPRASAPSSRQGALARPSPPPAPPPAFIPVARAINLPPPPSGVAPRLTRRAGAPSLGYALARGAHRPPGSAASGMLATRLVDSPLASSRPRLSPGSRSWLAVSFLPKMARFSFPTGWSPARGRAFFGALSPASMNESGAGREGESLYVFVGRWWCAPAGTLRWGPASPAHAMNPLA